MSRPSIRWLLLGVAGASLVLPLLALLLLRLLDPYLVQQTERQLNAEAVWIGEFYRAAWCRAHGVPPGDPRPPERASEPFTPYEGQLRNLRQLAPPMPHELPKRRGPSPLASDGAALSGHLRSAQIFNLSGVRVLDETGCAIASSREQLDYCFSSLPEVRRALSGVHATAIRERISDEPHPPVGGVRRRGDLRVFVAHPVFNAGRLIGAVWLSRTAESGLEFIFKQRRDLFYGGIFLICGIVGISAIFAGSIIRPLRRMANAAEALARGESPPPLSAIPAPREIHALGSAFDTLTQRLQERARYVGDFAAHVSHELKTPLTSIRGAVELLLEQGPAMHDAQRERFLTNIDAAAARTARLVERLLLLARLENPSELAPTESMTVDAWLEQAALRWGKDVTFEATPDARTIARPLLELDSVLGNLIDNALRYRRLQPVRVLLEARADQLCVTVTDDGPGISPENQARLFERFFTTERDRGGTGLGLSIVKAIAESHAGTVEVTSTPAGTEVSVLM
ncbi:MAG TPA: HAMP domain-containing sensor histidine kinase [Polyangiaceae bacterium]